MSELMSAQGGGGEESHTSTVEMSKGGQREDGEERREQTKSPSQAQNRLMNPNEPLEESNRDRERESTAEYLNLGQRLGLYVASGQKTAVSG